MRRFWVATALALVFAAAVPAAAAPARIESNATVYQVGAAAPDDVQAKFHESMLQHSAGFPAGQVKDVTSSSGQEGFVLQSRRMTFGGDGKQSGAMAAGHAVAPMSGGLCYVDASVEYYNNNGSLHVTDLQCYGDNPPRPRTVTVTWWKAPVTSYNAPAQVAKTTSVNCTWGNNYCRGMSRWFDSHRPNITSTIFPSVTVDTQNGQVSTENWAQWFYNDVAYPYPHIRDTRFDGTHLIPFRIPTYGWYTCEDTAVPGPCERKTWFRPALVRWYDMMHWSYGSNWEAHHIAMVSKGGGNDLYQNGVLLDPAIHAIFTNRWEPQFRPRGF